MKAPMRRFGIKKKGDTELLRKEIGTGRTVEAAIADGARKLGADPSRAQYEIIEAPKKGFLGFGEAPAKVWVYIEVGSEQVAVDYITKLAADMDMSVNVELARELNSEGGKIIKVTGDGAGVLIGHHGETLDALQYLSNLAVNRYNGENGEDTPKLTVDVEGYRSRREETLRAVARRTAEKVVKYRRNIALEPMTPYERRIVHSCLQNFRGVTTSSTGADADRRVVVYYDAKTVVRRNGDRRRTRDAEVGAEQDVKDVQDVLSASDTVEEALADAQVSEPAAEVSED